jgi:hypothetical protein
MEEEAAKQIDIELKGIIGVDWKRQAKTPSAPYALRDKQSLPVN